MSNEQVVLLDEGGCAVGVADKAAVHHAATPLHLAFSSYVFDSSGKVLMTRRAESKKTWPGVWTNSCCGHPLPGEEVSTAVRRRLRSELGVEVQDVDLVLPQFRYRAVMPNGVVENEMCPVFRVRWDGDPEVDPAEVDKHVWVDWREGERRDLERAVGAELSPWCALQLTQLAQLGPDPLSWPTVDPSQMPPN